MSWLWRATWLVTLRLVVQSAGVVNTSLPTPAANHSRARALSLEDREDVGYQSSYFPYPPAPYPPPSYGPPTEIPEGMVHIEFAFDEIVLRCIAEEPFEHIVWTRYQCPQQFLFGGEGVHIADGSNVYQHDLYDVHIRGHDGTIISELLIKNPLAESSEGIYQCEAWPHLHGGGGYLPYGHYHSYNPPKSNIFIIGGSSLLEDCYHVSSFGLQPNKLVGITNKQGTSSDKDVKVKQTLALLKPRHNATASRKDSNSKRLHYNLRYIDNTLYNVEGLNVTADYFRPSRKVPAELRNHYQNVSKLSGLLNPPINLTSSIFDFTGRSNDKFIQIFPKQNARKGKNDNLFLNSTVKHQGNNLNSQ